MNFSVEIEVCESIGSIDPGARCLAEEPELFLHPLAASAVNQMQSQLTAFPETQVAIQLL
jgi:hypothetical protein